MRYIFLLLCIWSILIMGCQQPQTTQEHRWELQQSASTKDLVNFSLLTQTPPSEQSPREHLWYGIRIAWNKGYILSAQHVIPDDLNRLVITDYSWNMLHIEQLWTHPSEDIVLLQTNSVYSGSTIASPLNSNTVFFRAQDEHDIRWKKHATVHMLTHSIALLEGIHALPWSSGNPVYDEKTNNPVWIITSDTNAGIEVTLFTPSVMLRIHKSIWN